jgi:thioredoxin reductase (NADPH)
MHVSTLEIRTLPLVIIGSGPAAWTAAIYAGRAALNPVLYEGEPVGTDLPGGQLMLTTDIENFPGFPEPISGPALMERMKEQALRYGVEVHAELVADVDLSERPFRITPSYSAPVLAHTIIVATGAKAKWIGLANELRLAQVGGGVSACAVCDGALPHFRNKVLAVVGGGDTAMEEALYLTKFAREVVIVHRRDAFRASKAMAARVLSHPKIRVEWNTQVADVLGDAEIEALRLRDTRTGAERELPVGGLFVAIGHEPNTGFLKGQLETTPHGYIVTTPGRTATTRPGVFAAGDVIDDYYRQAITSAGTGCQAALEAERYLAHHGIGESPVLETAETVVCAQSDSPTVGVAEINASLAAAHRVPGAGAPA